MAAVSARPRLIAAAAFVLLAAVAAIWTVPPLLDWDRYRDRLSELASAGLGRPVTIDGPISLQLLPQPVLSAARVTMADPGDGASANVGEMRLQVDLAGLLAGRVDVSDLLLRGAAIRLPWPPGVTQRRPPVWLTRLHARIEDSTLQVGGLSVASIDGDLSVDAQTGTLSASGLADLLGRRWRMGGRLGQAGSDGSATLDISLDGEGEIRDTGGTLSGQIAGDGTLAGQVKARGPDLSLLVAAPALAWHASGRVSAGGGLAVASDMDLDLGGSPAIGAVALRLLPAVRIDAALSASRLDLDAWLPVLLRGGGTALPTGLDLSVEQASLAGGTVGRLHAGFEVTQDGVVVRDAEAVLPGAAALHLTGIVSHGRFAGDARFDATALRETLRWLRPYAPALIDALPVSALRSASLTARVDADPTLVALAGLAGRVDSATVAGDVRLRPGTHPGLAATLAVSGLQMEAWLPPGNAADWTAALTGPPREWPAFDLDLALNATRSSWRGIPLDALTLETRLWPGHWDVRRAVLRAAFVSGNASFKMGEGGALTDAQLNAVLPHMGILQRLWPAAGVPQALLDGPATVSATGSGPASALDVSLAADIADGRLEAAGKADLVRRRWSGSVSARHPGAPRLLEMLGLPGVAAWLGDGSMSLLAQLDAAPGLFALKDAEMAAGALRATVSLILDVSGAIPRLTGEIAAETLPLPLPGPRSAEPLPFGALQGWQTHLSVRAAHVLLGDSPILEDANADVAVESGALRLSDVAGGLAGGYLTGSFTVASADGTPPVLALEARIASAKLPEPLADSMPDLFGGRLDGIVSLHATGYSPAALLATLSGEASVSVQSGTLVGVDLAAAAALLGQADPDALRDKEIEALAGGVTAFSRLDLSASAKRGAVKLRQAVLTAPAGRIDAGGAFDLPAGTEDLRMSLLPGGGPRLEVRLIGPVSRPHRTFGLADITRFLSERHAGNP